MWGSGPRTLNETPVLFAKRVCYAGSGYIRGTALGAARRGGGTDIGINGHRFRVVMPHWHRAVNDHNRILDGFLSQPGAVR